MTVLLVTNHVPPDRRAPFAALHERVGLELALFGGRSHHATGSVDDPGVPHRHVAQKDIATLAAGEWDAVVCGTAGRVALPAAYLGARRAPTRTPFVLWSALWAQPRSAAHLAGGALLGHLYREADAVAAYGEHVAAHARARGARRIHLAPQAVDAAFWGAAVRAPTRAGTTFGFVGRDAPGKGVPVLLDAWTAADLPDAALELVGVPDGPAAQHVTYSEPTDPAGVRDFYASCDVLVVPSVPTPTFREPWGLVVNEAMHQGLPVIATDAVGAAAGGLVRHERNGLVVGANDAPALAAAMERVHADPALRERLGAQARRDVAAFTPTAWADGMAAAIATAQARRS